MRRIAAIVVITLSVAPVAAWPESKAESEAEKKIEDNFKVSLSSITYSKTLSFRSPAVAGRQGPAASERLSLLCEVEILDPNRVLGICRLPMIEKVADGRSKSVAIGSVSPRSGDTRYDLLRYRRRSVKFDPAPWENAVRSVLRLPRKVGSRPQWFKELESSRMQINLDAGFIKRPNKQIDRVKGYFYALVAESLEYVDVPFERMDGWMRLTPDLEIRVSDAWCEESKYRLCIRGRPEAEGSAPPLSVHSYLPDRLLVARQVLGLDDKPIRHPAAIHDLSDSLTDEAAVYGGSRIDQITKIRFVIAVSPRHHEIPFVLDNIPLPKP